VDGKKCPTFSKQDRYAQAQISIFLTIRVTNIVLKVSLLLLVGCTSVQQKDTDLLKQSESAKIEEFQPDIVVLAETFQQRDTAYNEYLADRLKPIRENFRRINSIAKWTSVRKIETNESTEGGDAAFYYSGKVLEKILIRHFGENFQQLTEYYLMNGELSFVFDKLLKYNQPIYNDSTSMDDSSDSQFFDFEKSEIVEERNYFEKEKLIHQVNNRNFGSPLTEDYLLNEQKRIITEYNKFKKIK
jgi:hypothetical protein